MDEGVAASRRPLMVALHTKWLNVTVEHVLQIISICPNPYWTRTFDLQTPIMFQY